MCPRGLRETTNCGIWSYSAPILVFLARVQSRFPLEIRRGPFPSLLRAIGQVHRADWMAGFWVAEFQVVAAAARGTSVGLAVVGILPRSKFPGYQSRVAPIVGLQPSPVLEDVRGH